MGGFNSGGGRSASRTDAFLSLDLASLKRLGLHNPGSSGTLSWMRGDEPSGSIGIWMLPDRLQLIYRSRRYREEWDDIRESIPIVETDAGFGGRRRWFVCPSCSCRVRILYGGHLFRCRKCRGATYESQYEPMFSASHKRIGLLRRKLRDNADSSWDQPPERPKGMHKTTYERLCHEIWREQMKMERALASYVCRRFPELAASQDKSRQLRRAI